MHLLPKYKKLLYILKIWLYPVRSITIGYIDTILTFWLYYTTTMDFKWNDKMCFNCRLSALICGIYIQIRWRCRNYNSLHMCLPLVKGPKVMGQNNNHKSNFPLLILGCKSFAVNYSLKSGTHRHHQTLGFIPGDALPGLYCNRLQFLLVLGAFSLQFCLQQVKCMLNRIQVRWLTWPLHNSPLLSLQKLFGCFCSMLWVIVHLHCEALSNEFWSIWLNTSR